MSLAFSQQKSERDEESVIHEHAPVYRCRINVGLLQLSMASLPAVHNERGTWQADDGAAHVALRRGDARGRAQPRHGQTCAESRQIQRALHEHARDVDASMEEGA